MKLIFLLIFGVNIIYSQNKSIEYFKNIDKLKFEEKLQKISILDSKTCIGNAETFFSNKELVLIEGNDGGEFSEQNYKFYIEKGEILKLNIIEYSNSKKIGELEIIFDHKDILYKNPKNFKTSYPIESIKKCGQILIPEFIKLQKNHKKNDKPDSVPSPKR